jgi:alpha-galactosidase
MKRIRNADNFPQTNTAMQALLLLALALSPLAATTVHALDNGLALTPPMGWSSWPTLRCSLTGAIVQEIMDLLVKTGLADAGYKFVNIGESVFFFLFFFQISDENS